MAVSDTDLEVRSKQNNRIHLAIAIGIIVVGVLMFITIALAPLGFFVVPVGVVYLVVALMMGRVSRLNETHHSPSEPK
jgi:Na+/pantothenate symporter